MRVAPQKGLAVAIFRIKAVISRLACGRPVRLLLEIHAQKRRKPFRCQDTTVSGLTITRTRPILPGPGQSHPEQTIRASQPRPRALPLEDRELLTEGQVLQGDFSNATGWNQEETKQREHGVQHERRHKAKSIPFRLM